MNEIRPTRRGSGLFGGIVLILLGTWFLLDRLGLDMPGLGELWPLFPLLGGLALTASYVLGRETDPGVLIPGIGGALVGFFFLMITIGPLTWSDLDELWPIFPLIGGLAFGGVWLASGRRDSGLLVPAGGGIAVGVIGLVFTYDLIDLPVVSVLWPLVIIGAGVWMIVKSGRR